MPELSEIQLPSGSIYKFRDDVARSQQAGAIVNRGVSMTALSDFSTTKTINIATLTEEEPADWSTDYTSYYTYNSDTHTFTAVPEGSGAPAWEESTYYAAVSRTCEQNDAVFYITHEFVFDGTAWHEFGDMSGLAAVATTGDYNDLTNKPTIPAAQVNSDWDAASGVAQILNKPTIPTVDQQYDSSSTNAQSGTAVAAAIANQGSDSVTPVSAKTVVTAVSASSPSSTQATGEVVYVSVSGTKLILSKIVQTTGDSVTAGTAKTFVTPTT